MVGARVFVTTSFVILGVSFIASTALLIWEFWEVDWPTMVVAHSYLFFFFPVLGILALCAFYLPSVVFAHLYWNHIPYGRLRFLTGLVVVLVLSFGFAWYLRKDPRSVWEASPEALLADKRDTGGGRVAILSALGDLRDKAQERTGLSSFARNCKADPLLEEAEDMAKKRYCFPAQTQLVGAACCKVQAQFALAVKRLERNPDTRSLSATLDPLVFLPLKVFFVLIIVAIGALLAVWRDSIDLHYAELGAAAGAQHHHRRVRHAVLAGNGLRLPADRQRPVRPQRRRPPLRLSIVIAPWVLLLLFYFLRRLGKQGELVGQISGVVVAAVAVLRLEQLNDWVGRVFGIGADAWILMLQGLFAVAGLLALLMFRRAGRYPGETVPT